MTRSEAAPSSTVEYEKDRNSRSLPGGRSGPNEDGASAIGGPEALGIEIGAEDDVHRGLTEAKRDGDVLLEGGLDKDGQSAGQLGFGQKSVYEKDERGDPGPQEREQAQNR